MDDNDARDEQPSAFRDYTTPELGVGACASLRRAQARRALDRRREASWTFITLVSREPGTL